MMDSNESLRDAFAEIVEVPTVAPAPVRSQDSYFVVARMNHEHETVDSLRRNRVGAYFPSFEQVTWGKDRGGASIRRVKRVGILPGYVFATPSLRIDFELLLRHIVGAFDVARTFSGKPLFICEDDLQIIRRIEIGLNTPREPEKTVHAFKVGQKVKFLDDLVGRWPSGRVEKLASEGRIGVEVELMGRKVLIWALSSQIERT
jgi:transcription antitermination factor NusG